MSQPDSQPFDTGVPGNPLAQWFRRGPLAVCLGREGGRWYTI